MRRHGRERRSPTPPRASPPSITSGGIPCRFESSTLDANGCLTAFTCIPDGTAGNFNPWEGLVFDLGGPSNKVAIFATNDHGPQPCESLEYTVYLSDNPLAKSKIDQPAMTGVDPQQWNRAVLKTVYTDGWYNTRAPDPVGHASCGDTADYAVEQDSFVQVFSLPCGITFRYAAVIAGNDGLDFPACQYASSEAELDAVAGLTESGAGVCPDADGDHYVDCNCPSAPPVCDCDDSDPMVHPGAPESCDSTIDYNCDGKKGFACPAGKVCYMGLCDDLCPGENPLCPAGADCSNTDAGKVCVPSDCGGGCPERHGLHRRAVRPRLPTRRLPRRQRLRRRPLRRSVRPELHQVPDRRDVRRGSMRVPVQLLRGQRGLHRSAGHGLRRRSLETRCVPPKCKGVACPHGSIDVRSR